MSEKVTLIEEFNDPYVFADAISERISELNIGFDSMIKERIIKIFKEIDDNGKEISVYQCYIFYE